MGHICEGCRSDDILFPFQVEAVSKCPGCNACYHRYVVTTMINNQQEFCAWNIDCDEKLTYLYNRPCLENLGAEGCSKCRRLTTTREMKKKRLQEVESDEDDGPGEAPMA